MNATISTRVCGTCNKEKDVSQFYKDGTDSSGSVKYRRDCKECYRVTRLANRRVKSRAQAAKAAPPKASAKKAKGKR